MYPTAQIVRGGVGRLVRVRRVHRTSRPRSSSGECLNELLVSALRAIDEILTVFAGEAGLLEACSYYSDTLLARASARLVRVFHTLTYGCNGGRQTPPRRRLMSGVISGAGRTLSGVQWLENWQASGRW